jgi:hypothetical protein
MSESDPSPMDDAQSDALAERLAHYAALPATQDQRQMQRDLLSASRQIADFHVLLNAWRAAFAHRDIGQEFAEILGTAGMNEAWKRRLQLKVVTHESPETS